ncbi:methylthioribose-1-phosphate isomerase [Planctomycetales bacterium]|nr:methylthioribose-1-phosphate isomerase [Planctomycetales bacterium]GHT07146.1 methylthioribose-1-phosphate isomerase [Planctomycetales bacterium]
MPPSTAFPRTLYWRSGAAWILDQTLLPEKKVYLRIDTPPKMFAAIRKLAVRGAPAIGCAAAFGCLLTALKAKKTPTAALVKQICRDADYLATSRPTALNLFWALERMKKAADAHAALPPSKFQAAVLAAAQNILDEDAARCRQIGENGLRFLRPRADGKPLGILTHCNAGALATGGGGTALAPIYLAAERFAAERFAAERQMPLRVFADETRPLLQGARLTAWELSRAQIPVTLICDNMAAQVMREGKIDLVIVGADRIAANGDTANKIGTSGVALLAAHFKIPFYVAAPSSTFDLTLKDGGQIPIEQRDGDEVRKINGKFVAPRAVAVYNPAFDVTPANLITAIIHERGVIERPTTGKIARAINN